MARALNKNRMLGSRMAVAIAVLTVLLSKQYWPEETASHEIFEITGVVLTGICAIGRVYATAFLGGYKNEALITHGIYSVVRNPLYFFSLIGITGVAMMSNHIFVMIGLPLFFAYMYRGLIQREQDFLQDKFGDEYKDYTRQTCALIPNFGNYSAPESLQINPRYLTKALLDAVWWLSALPIIELTEALHAHHILPTLFVG